MVGDNHQGEAVIFSFGKFQIFYHFCEVTETKIRTFLPKGQIPE